MYLLKKRNKKSFFIFLVLSFSFVFLVIPVSTKAVSKDLSGYAWNDHVGWISMKGSNYKVTLDIINDTIGKLSGYAWSDRIGWIDFAPSSGSIGFPEAPNYSARVDLSTGLVTGWARSITYKNYDGSGWIKMGGTAVNGATFGLKFSANGLVNTSVNSEKYIWSENIGWIDMSGVYIEGALIDHTLTVVRPSNGNNIKESILSEIMPQNINCGVANICSGVFGGNSSLYQIHAEPANGYTFSSWSGCTSTNNDDPESPGQKLCTIRMNENKVISATFIPISSTVTLNKNGGTGGTASVTATFGSAMPTATAPTRTGYTFAGYYDTSAATGGTQYYTAAMASARTWDKTGAQTLWARWTCATGYHLESGACVPNTRPCSPMPAGTTAGTQTWNTSTNSWGVCVATACSPTYVLSSGVCAQRTIKISSVGAAMTSVNITGPQTIATGNVSAGQTKTLTTIANAGTYNMTCPNVNGYTVSLTASPTNRTIPASGGTLTFTCNYSRVDLTFIPTLDRGGQNVTIGSSGTSGVIMTQSADQKKYGICTDISSLSLPRYDQCSDSVRKDDKLTIKTYFQDTNGYIVGGAPSFYCRILDPQNPSSVSRNDCGSNTISVNNPGTINQEVQVIINEPGLLEITLVGTATTAGVSYNKKIYIRVPGIGEVK